VLNGQHLAVINGGNSSQAVGDNFRLFLEGIEVYSTCNLLADSTMQIITSSANQRTKTQQTKELKWKK